MNGTRKRMQTGAGGTKFTKATRNNARGMRRTQRFTQKQARQQVRQMERTAQRIQDFARRAHIPFDRPLTEAELRTVRSTIPKRFALPPIRNITLGKKGKKPASIRRLLFVLSSHLSTLHSGMKTGKDGSLTPKYGAEMLKPLDKTGYKWGYNLGLKYK